MKNEAGLRPGKGASTAHEWYSRFTSYLRMQILHGSASECLI